MSHSSPKNKSDQIVQSQQLLASQRPIDIKLGLDMLFGLLASDPEDPEVYSFVVAAGREHESYQGYIKERLETLSAEGSKSAQRARDELIKVAKTKERVTNFSSITVSIEDQLARADDLYYAAQYDQAIQLYQEVIQNDPHNSRAIDQLKKAELLKEQENLNKQLPREAVQFYRRARSYLNAKDIRGAASLLSAAHNSAEERGVSFPEAQELLASLDDALAALEFRENAEAALRSDNLDEAQRQLNYVLALDNGDVTSQNLLKQIQTLRTAKQMAVHKDNIRLAVELMHLTDALEIAQKAIVLDPSDSFLGNLMDEISSVINTQREVSLLETADSSDCASYQKILDELYSIKHPWLVETKIIEKISSKITLLRKEKSDFFEKQGRTQLEHAKEALYLSVMLQLSGKAIESFETARECDSERPDIPNLISEAKAIKDNVTSILNGDEKSFFDFLKRKAERQIAISDITKRMEIVITEFDESSEDYKYLWKQLESLFDKKTKSLSASDDRVAVVLAKTDAEIRNNLDRRPWGTALVIAILLLILSVILLASNPKRTIIPFTTDFPADLVLYSSLFGSAMRVIVELSDRRRTKWVDAIRLTFLRPLIGMGVTLLIVLFAYSGLGKIMAFNPAMGFWGYVSLSSIIGYSDSIMNQIIQVLEKGISIKV